MLKTKGNILFGMLSLRILFSLTLGSVLCALALVAQLCANPAFLPTDSAIFAVLPNPTLTTKDVKNPFGVYNSSFGRDDLLIVENTDSTSFIHVESPSISLAVSTDSLIRELASLIHFENGDELEDLVSSDSYTYTPAENLISIYSRHKDYYKRQVDIEKIRLGGTPTPGDNKKTYKESRTPKEQTYATWKTPDPTYLHESHNKLPDYLGPQVDTLRDPRKSLIVRFSLWIYFDIPMAIAGFFVHSSTLTLVTVFIVGFFILFGISVIAFVLRK